ncbi:MAG: zf-HC2 domain-containing protein [Chloroflexi bacterium]|nr:zf-HC2 domain-containing protein [Chloroflexota bacterium]
MTCPDEVRFDGWLDGELSAAETADIRAHVAECPRCVVRAAERQAEEALWRTALVLDPVELACLDTARLAARWQRGSVGLEETLWWPALLGFGALASYLAWLAILPTLEGLLAAAGWLGGLWLVVGAGLVALREALAALSGVANSPLGGDPTLVIAVASFLLWLLITRPWHMLASEH